GEIDPLEAEVAAHEAFGEERARFFTGRAGHLERIAGDIEGRSSHPLVVWGQSGSGKSALLAKAAQQAEEEQLPGPAAGRASVIGWARRLLRPSEAQGPEEARPQPEVIYRFIGATPTSSNGRMLLEGLCRQISRRYGADEDEIPLEYSDLVRAFPQRLALATAERPLILFLDGLDQLSDAHDARALAWLPERLPDHVHLVVSTLPGGCKSALEAKLPPERLLELAPMPQGEADELLDLWLKEAGRTLQPEQRQHVLARFAQCPRPLYLKLAFEEARRWRSYDGLPAGAGEAPGLSPDIDGVIRDLLARLSSAANHGPLLVSRSLGYLAAARNGLTEDELLDVLARDVEVYAWFLRSLFHTPPDLLRRVRAYLQQERQEGVSDEAAETWLEAVRREEDGGRLRGFLSSVLTQEGGLRLPVVLWSRLYADLEPYLTQRAADGTSLLGFYHRQVRQVTRAEYLDQDARVDRHQALASYFGGQELEIDRADERLPNQRKLSELPYQQVGGRLAGQLVDTIADYRFLATKIASQGVHQAIDDYRRALRSGLFAADQGPESRYSGLDTIHRTLLLASYVIHKDPAQLPSQLLGRLETEHKNPIVRRLLADAVEVAERPWIRSLKPGLISPFGAVHRSFHGHTGEVMDVAVTPDGRQIVSASLDNTLKVCNLENGLELHTLAGHSKGVQRVALTPDGKRAVSASWDHTLKVWNLATGRRLRTLAGHDERVLSVAISPDNGWIFSGDWLGQVKAWHLESGRERRSYQIHDGPIWSIAVSPDGARCASGSEDRTVKVWEPGTGRVQRTLDGHGDKVFGVAFSCDGRRIVSGSWDGQIRVWDAGNGTLIRKLNGLGGNVWSVAVTPDDRQVLGGLSNGLIRVWDIESGQLLRSLEGHTNWVSAVVPVPEGNRIVSGSFDFSVIVWDLDRQVTWEEPSGDEELAPPVDHGVVTGVGIAGDGRRAFATHYNGALLEWDLETGARTGGRPTHFLDKGGSKIDASGRFLVQVRQRTPLKVRELDDLERIKPFFQFPLYRPNQDQITSFAISPDRRRFLFGTRNGTLVVLDLTREQEGLYGRYARLLEAKVHDGRINAIAVTP
ncbi:MAG: AAA family ATPase, partial [Anaerolineae bacterium]